MKKQEKVFEVQNLSAKIKEAKSVALADYKGLNTSQLNDLRNKVKEAGGELQIVKNTLLARALKENNYKVEKADISGSSIALFSLADEISPLKALAAFAKTVSLLPFKIGFMAERLITADELKQLASLPSRFELQTKLVGLLIGQPSRLVYALNWNLQRLVIALNGVKNKKQ